MSTFAAIYSATNKVCPFLMEFEICFMPAFCTWWKNAFDTI